MLCGGVFVDPSAAITPTIRSQSHTAHTHIIRINLHIAASLSRCVHNWLRSR